MDPAVVGQIKELTKNLRIRRYAVITAAVALLARGWSGNGSEVALDFPVSRRVLPETKTLPGMFAGRGASGAEDSAGIHGCRILPAC